MPVGGFKRLRCNNDLVHLVQDWGNGGWIAVCDFTKQKNWGVTDVPDDEPLTCLACLAWRPQEKK